MHFHSRLRISATALFVVFACQSMTAQEPRWWTDQKRDCHLAPSLAYETWRQQGSPCDDGAPPVNNQERERQQQLELERQQLELEQQRQLQRQQEEMERNRKANEADQKGLDAANRGHWKEAASLFIQALGFAPKSAEIRSHLDRANLAIADAGSAAEILALRQRIEDAIATANIGAWRQQMEEEVAMERLKAMSESVRGQMLEDRPGSTNPAVGGSQVLYPVLLKSVSRSSPPAKVLSQYQPKIREINAEIHRAQDALRRLIQSNTQSEEERLEWTRESAEATTDAQNLAVSLVYDLVGARVDYLAEINGKERAVVLNQLVNRAEADGRRSLHTAYGILLNRKHELESLKINVESASKLNELSTMIRESANQSAMENLWDVVSQFEKVEDFAGPSKDLLDAAYTIYRQAASLENLAVIQANQEKSLQAAAGLRRYIVRLQAQKKSLPR